MHTSLLQCALKQFRKLNEGHSNERIWLHDTKWISRSFHISFYNYIAVSQRELPFKFLISSFFLKNRWSLIFRKTLLYVKERTKTSDSDVKKNTRVNFVFGKEKTKIPTISYDWKPTVSLLGEFILAEIWPKLRFRVQVLANKRILTSKALAHVWKTRLLTVRLS